MMPPEDSKTGKGQEPQVRKYKVTTFRYRLFCPCGGEARANGVSYGPIGGTPICYGHTCQKCGKSVSAKECYPLSEREREQIQDEDIAGAT